MGNHQRCPYLRAAGIPVNQSLVGVILGYSGFEPLSLEDRNRARRICWECPLSRCIDESAQRMKAELEANDWYVTAIVEGKV